MPKYLSLNHSERLPRPGNSVAPANSGIGSKIFNHLNLRYAAALLAVAFVARPTLVAAQTVTHFVAELSSANVIAAGVNASTDPATGMAFFTLTQPADPAATTLSYDIHLNGLDLDGLQTPGMGNEGDNVTAIHLHDVRQCVSPACGVGDTAGTMHVLNIFGIPRGGDDDDMTYNPVAGTVRGLWDDADADPAQSPAPTFPISQVASDLLGGNFFLMVHDNDFPNGAIGGLLRQVPEPSSWLLVAVAMTAVAVGRRTRRTQVD